jgi:PEP-CTERM motif.
MRKIFILLSFLIVVLCFTVQVKADSTWNFKIDTSISPAYRMNDGTVYQYGGDVLERKSTQRLKHPDANNPTVFRRLGWGLTEYRPDKEGWDDPAVYFDEAVTGMNGEVFSMYARDHYSYFDVNLVNSTGNYTVGSVGSGGLLQVIEFLHTNNNLPSINGDGLLPYPELIEIFLSLSITNNEDSNLGYTEVVPFHLGFIETDNNIIGQSHDDVFFFLYPEALKNPHIVGDYTISFVMSGVTLMDQSSEYYQLAFDTLGAKEGDEIWGWRTEENRDTPLPFSFEIIGPRDVVDTPEPASMLFLGGSLAGFGLIRRYRMKRKQNA